MEWVQFSYIITGRCLTQFVHLHSERAPVKPFIQSCIFIRQRNVTPKNIVTCWSKYSTDCSGTQPAIFGEGTSARNACLLNGEYQPYHGTLKLKVLFSRRLAAISGQTGQRIQACRLTSSVVQCSV
jgi:hypothetical protein